MMNRLIVVIAAVLFVNVVLCLPGAMAVPDQKTDAISADDYALYTRW